MLVSSKLNATAKNFFNRNCNNNKIIIIISLLKKHFKCKKLHIIIVISFFLSLSLCLSDILKVRVNLNLMINFLHNLHNKQIDSRIKTHIIKIRGC